MSEKEIISEYNRLAKTNRYTGGQIYDKLAIKFKTTTRDKIKSIIFTSKQPK